MKQIARLDFKTILINDISRELHIVTYSKANFSIYFSLQSIAQCINILIEELGAKEIFTMDFFHRWQDLDLKCFTEYQLQLLIPLNLIMDPATEIYNPVPLSLRSIRYLNFEYGETVNRYSQYDQIVHDIFCIAERLNLTSDENTHKFTNSLGFLSLIPILKLKYVRILYFTFFDMNHLDSHDIEYIAQTLTLNRQRLMATDISNVFQLEPENVTFNIDIIDEERKFAFIMKFNRACKIFKSFAFNIMDEQSSYISKNLNVMTQFGLDRRTIEDFFKAIPRMSSRDLTTTQIQLLCEPHISEFDKMGENELYVLKSIIKIHLMIQRMTGVSINDEDLKFYTRILHQKFTTDLDSLLYSSPNDNCNQSTDIVSYETGVGSKRILIKNYTMGEILLEFIQLYQYAQTNLNTIWICKFIETSCSPRFSNLVNIMADFVPFFQHFFTNDFNINSINNIIIFLQGMCAPDEQNINMLKNPKDFKIKQMNVQNFKTFSLTRYKSYNTNPLITFIELLLGSRQKMQYLINLNTMSDMERHKILSLIDPGEQKFIDYIYDLIESDPNDVQDLSGNRRFNLENIDYDKIVPIVSTNTFNENNTSISSLQLFNGIINQTTFFHELSNRIIYKIPGVVCNIITK